MTTLRLELRSQDGGAAYLNYWGYRGGEGIVLRLTPDGTVYELSFPPGEDETEIWTPIDLVARLLELCRD